MEFSNNSGRTKRNSTRCRKARLMNISGFGRVEGESLQLETRGGYALFRGGARDAFDGVPVLRARFDRAP